MTLQTAAAAAATETDQRVGNRMCVHKSSNARKDAAAATAKFRKFPLPNMLFSSCSCFGRLKRRRLPPAVARYRWLRGLSAQRTGAVGTIRTSLRTIGEGWTVTSGVTGCGKGKGIA
jgi:hypothetical protein